MRGDHLVVDRGLYRHHAVDRGDGTVVHFAGPSQDKALVSARIDTFEGFANGGTVWVRIYGQRLEPEETVRQAEALLGATGYPPLSNNCEHLASWGVTGTPASTQGAPGSAAGAPPTAAPRARLGPAARPPPPASAP